MPRVDLPLTEITRAGVAPGAEVTADPANDHSFANDGRVFLLARNSGAGSHTVTIVTPGTVDEQAIADVGIAIPAGASRYIGPFPPSIYGSPVSVDVASNELRLTAYHLS
jgi:hypothetical protein